MANEYIIESVATLTSEIQGSSNMSGSITSQTSLSGSAQITRRIDDHRLLVNRDAPGQHPISSIIDLENELDEMITVNDVMTNSDIENILRRFA